jgi:uncharacterized membrane protein
MTIAEAVGIYNVLASSWHDDWAWGLPMIVLSVLVHVFGLGYAYQKAIEVFRRKMHTRHPSALFAVIMSGVIFVATTLHAVEAALWALAYLFLSAQPDFKAAMLYSLGAMTTLGNGGEIMEERWLLLGSIEALCGWLLFGLTTAYLFATIQRFHLIETGNLPSQFEIRKNG